MANHDYNPDLPDGPHNDPGAAATPSEAAHEFARNVGAENTDQEWVLSPYDSWHRNPFYTGKPGWHPEDDYPEDE